MRTEFAQQYNVPCVVLFGGETFEEVTARCRLDEAIFDDGEDECYVLRFPGRPQELYTAQALRRSLPSQSDAGVDGG